MTDPQPLTRPEWATVMIGPDVLGKYWAAWDGNCWRTGNESGWDGPDDAIELVDDWAALAAARIEALEKALEDVRPWMRYSAEGKRWFLNSPLGQFAALREALSGEGSNNAE